MPLLFFKSHEVGVKWDVALVIFLWCLWSDFYGYICNLWQWITLNPAFPRIFVWEWQLTTMSAQIMNLQADIFSHFGGTLFDHQGAWGLLEINLLYEEWQKMKKWFWPGSGGSKGEEVERITLHWIFSFAMYIFSWHLIIFSFGNYNNWWICKFWICNCKFIQRNQAFFQEFCEKIIFGSATKNLLYTVTEIWQHLVDM